MQNIPDKIYLQIGEEVDADEDIDFNKLAGVSWCSDKIYDSDLVYFNAYFMIEYLKKNTPSKLERLIIESLNNK